MKILLIDSNTESVFIAVENFFFYTTIFTLAIPLDIPAHSNSSDRTMLLLPVI